MKAVIFDIGNVIYDDRWDLIHDSFREEFGVVSPEEWERGFRLRWDEYKTGQVGQYEFWGEALRGMGINPSENNIEKSIGYFLQIWNEPREDVLDIAARLRKNYNVYALTNCCLESEIGLAKIQDNYPVFERIYMSHVIGKRKPDADSYIHVLEDNGLKPEECVFIDDKERNTRGAKALGMKAIVFESAGHLEEKLKELGML